MSTQAVKVKHLIKEVECAKVVIDDLVRENYELKVLLEQKQKYDQSKAPVQSSIAC